jgi:hypothetical protein
MCATMRGEKCLATNCTCVGLQCFYRCFGPPAIKIYSRATSARFLLSWPPAASPWEIGCADRKSCEVFIFQSIYGPKCQTLVCTSASPLRDGCADRKSQRITYLYLMGILFRVPAKIQALSDDKDSLQRQRLGVGSAGSTAAEPPRPNCHAYAKASLRPGAQLLAFLLAPCNAKSWAPKRYLTQRHTAQRERERERERERGREGERGRERERERGGEGGRGGGGGEREKERERCNLSMVAKAYKGAGASRPASLVFKTEL